MVKTIQHQDKEPYQCEECGFQYAEKEWAEKCEAPLEASRPETAVSHKRGPLTGRASCKEHHSCNIEITAHAVSHHGASADEAAKMNDKNFKTWLFYGSIGVAASLGFLLIFYWHLRLNSSIASLISNTADKPLYFWPYIILTLGAVVLFGVNASLLVYRWRKFGPPKLKSQAGTAGGSLVGVAAAACPVCGSVLLSAIGITGGLAAFPLGGLELKALSFGLLALPIWLTRKEIKKMECGDGTCPAPKDHTLKESDHPWLAAILGVIAVLAFVNWDMLKTDPALAKLASAQNNIINPGDNRLNSADVTTTGNPIYDEVVAKVLPEKGFQSKIALGDSVVKLVQNGVIDREKFLAIYEDRGGLPRELKDVLDKPSPKPILLTRQNANYYVNLLWPLGLANFMESNKNSPINGKSLFNFASTGGWNLGKEENGGAYFNKFKIVELTPEQEALVTKIAQNSYRPCCNNSTFFQDCNHGSALLGLLELGAAQGLSEDELWREALAFNSFWFPQQAIYNALYFKVVKGIDWENVDPKVAIGKDFSSASGAINIQAEIAKIPNLIPQHGGQDGGSCGTG